MSTVQVAIPMLRGKRRFHVEKGRRWSVVEHLMLDAVARQPSTAAELVEKSCLPRRVVVEAFIRLMRVGWVELEAGAEGSVFKATAIGKEQLGPSELKAATVTESRWMGFSIDRVAGDVFRGRSIYVYPRTEVAQSPDSERLVYLDPSARYAGEDMGAIFGALEGENEVIVGVDPMPHRLFEGYGVVTVRDGEIEGLPLRASDDLRSAILARAAESTPADGKGKPAPERVPARVASMARAEMVNVLFDQSDLVLGGDAHRSLLLKALGTATELVLLHSTFISPEGWQGLLPHMIGAAARGTKVKIVWGQSDDVTDSSNTRREAAKLRAAVAEAGRSDQILVHPFTTRSHAKVLVSDDGKGRWSAVVGSKNWLTADVSSFEASVRLREPKMVGEIVNHVAMMSFAEDGIWLPEAGELTGLGRRISVLPRGGGATAKMRVLLAPDHADLVLRARDGARKRIVVTSHRFGIAGKPLVIVPAVAAAKAKVVESRLYYGKTTGLLSGLDAAGVTAEIGKLGVAVRPVHEPRLHAKVLAWDDDALAVTSQNWLSADPSDFQLRREIGIYVEQTRIADAFIRRFEQALAASGSS